jgi:hypothetical protein
MRPKTYARFAGVIFAAEAAFVFVHRAVGARYPTFSFGHDVVVDVGLGVIWSLAAISMFVPHRRSLAIAVPAMFLSIVHGILFCVATGTPVGVPFLVAAAVLAFLLRQGAPALGFRALPRELGPSPDYMHHAPLHRTSRARR